MLMLNETEAEFAQRNDPDKSATYGGGWMEYIKAMRQAGIIVNGDGLLGPHSATTVMVRDGAQIVQDGPSPT